MRRRSLTLVALALVAAVVAGACGSKATGISVAIDPDPVPAQRLADGSYQADWDAIVADLTGVGGTIESLQASVMGGTVTEASLRNHPAGFRLPANLAFQPFARKVYHETVEFTASPNQAVAAQVTVRFKDENGQSYETTSQAPISLR